MGRVVVLYMCLCQEGMLWDICWPTLPRYYLTPSPHWCSWAILFSFRAKVCTAVTSLCRGFPWFLCAFFFWWRVFDLCAQRMKALWILALTSSHVLKERSSYRGDQLFKVKVEWECTIQLFWFCSCMLDIAVWNFWSFELYIFKFSGTATERF